MFEELSLLFSSDILFQQTSTISLYIFFSQKKNNMCLFHFPSILAPKAYNKQLLNAHCSDSDY